MCELHNLENQLKSVENQNIQLQKEINRCQGQINNQARTIELLLDVLINTDSTSQQDQLQNIRQYLY